MSKYISGNQKHLTLDDRIFIQIELSKGTFYNAKNFCIHRYHCKKTNACGKIILCGIKCTSCPTCNQTCPDFEREHCNRLDKAPYQIITNHPELELSVRSGQKGGLEQAHIMLRMILPKKTNFEFLT